MKKIAIVMTFVATLAFASCNSLFGVSNSAAASTGSACAQALVGLRASQKAGTLSIANANDLTNMLTVITAYNMLKSNKDNQAFRKSFTSGMVAGGAGIITNSNVNSIVNLLYAANALGSINSKNINSKGSTATGALTPVLNKLP